MNYYFFVFEIIIYGFFFSFLINARKKGIHKIMQLISGAVFGVLLEWVTIKQLNGYSYGKFMIMIADVPLVIGIAWSMIINSVMHFSDRLILPKWSKCILDGLLALNIDLAMATIATFPEYQ
ncbi:hypothetical protein Bccel_2877 [Pseudobacteroides cellulosolvens ATCC 35603 = DSM 2933]|uniref:Uncharacterized protein n=2 Tax=Pseudobacteroides cellulosolvens TaxID=35825 RepID=A0A0L6JP40_9FIRM|nr:hypothetical protein Bccel_2877 [Pseudobacteroides cellulosolvens ATCC 35603 = DSM 2933]